MALEGMKRPKREDMAMSKEGPMSLDDLLGDDSLAEEGNESEEGKALDHFTVDEAVAKLESAGYSIVPPEQTEEEGSEEDMPEDEEEGVSPPIDINGVV